jgi:hypothetical protein
MGRLGRRYGKRSSIAMKALEFRARVSANKTLDVPAEIAEQTPPEQAVQVIVLIPEAPEDREWAHLTTERFLAGYAEGDAIYDHLPAG